MGGWIALLVALQRKDRVKAVIGIAPAPDFVTEMYDGVLTQTQRDELTAHGLTYVPSGYEHPYPITKGLVDDGQRHRLLHTRIDLNCPIRIIQGTDDEAVAADKPERIKAALTTNDVHIHMIDGGNHSLSRPEDIAIIDGYIRDMS